MMYYVRLGNYVNGRRHFQLIKLVLLIGMWHALQVITLLTSHIPDRGRHLMMSLYVSGQT